MNRNPYLRVKLKSLAEESKIIRQEKQKQKRYGNTSVVNSLHWHRIDVVRAEARATLLAYQYLRGKPYHICEPKAKTEPNWDRVENMVYKYGGKKLNHKDWVRGELLKAA